MTKKGPFYVLSQTIGSCAACHHLPYNPALHALDPVHRDRALLVGILYLCRINTNLKQNAVDILQIQTENRQNYLQGQMLDAQDLSSLAGKINAVTQAMLDDGEISLDTLDSGSDAASPLLLSIGDSLISSMRHRPVTGIFLSCSTRTISTHAKGRAAALPLSARP